MADQQTFKHEITIGVQPKMGKPQLKTRCADLEIALKPDSPEEKMLANKMFDYLIGEMGGEDQFISMWVSKIQVGDQVRTWKTGDSIYVRHPDDSKKKPAAKPELSKEDWREWFKTWVGRGYEQNEEIPMILSAAQVARGGEPFTSVSKWDSTLSEATAVMTAESQSRKTAPPPPAQQPPARPARDYESMSTLEEKRNAIRIDYTIKIGGKDYLQVQGRVLLFRLDHPAESGWGIETDLANMGDDWALIKAVIRDDAGRVISSGFGRCTLKDAGRAQGRFAEKAETTAIGRALAIAGYGTDDSLVDSEDYISDSPR